MSKKQLHWMSQSHMIKKKKMSLLCYFQSLLFNTGTGVINFFVHNFVLHRWDVWYKTILKKLNSSSWFWVTEINPVKMALKSEDGIKALQSFIHVSLQPLQHLCRSKQLHFSFLFIWLILHLWFRSDKSCLNNLTHKNSFRPKLLLKIRHKFSYI